MAGTVKLIAEWWTALWPNLAASVIWAAPAFTIHHMLLRRHITRTCITDPRQAGRSAQR